MYMALNAVQGLSICSVRCQQNRRNCATQPSSLHNTSVDARGRTGESSQLSTSLALMRAVRKIWYFLSAVAMLRQRGARESSRGPPAGARQPHAGTASKGAESASADAAGGADSQQREGMHTFSNVEYSDRVDVAATADPATSRCFTCSRRPGTESTHGAPRCSPCPSTS